MNTFADLVHVTDVMQEQALERHRRNLEISQKLADELAQIDALRRAAQADAETIDARRLIGADALWQGWLVRKRAEILRNSAMARAHELESLAAARRAFARAEAAKTLQQEDRDARRKARIAHEADRLDGLSVLRHAKREAEIALGEAPD